MPDDGMREVASKLFDCAKFEDAKLRNFIVTARPEVIDMLAEFGRMCCEEILQMTMGPTHEWYRETVMEQITARLRARIEQNGKG